LWLQYDEPLSSFAFKFNSRRYSLTFVALLASVEGGEIIKALLEKDVEGSGETVVLASGLSYVDKRVVGRCRLTPS